MWAGQPASPLRRGLGDGNGALGSAVLARRLAGQAQHETAERRTARAHLVDSDLGAPQPGRDLLHQDKTLPWRRQRQPVRPPVVLRLSAADANKGMTSLVTLP